MPHRKVLLIPKEKRGLRGFSEIIGGKSPLLKRSSLFSYEVPVRAEIVLTLLEFSSSTEKLKEECPQEVRAPNKN